jgi:hypothetical protein
MDPGTASVIVAAMASTATVLAALIGALMNSERAADKAKEPLEKEIARLREKVITLKGDPDEH